jgi:hypothetical protein
LEAAQEPVALHQAGSDFPRQSGIGKQLFTLESRYGKAGYAVTCRGHLVHFHAARGSHKFDFAVGESGTQTVGNADCREDVATGAPT